MLCRTISRVVVLNHDVPPATQRGLLPAKPSDVGLDLEDETEGGIASGSGSEESEEESGDEALDLNALEDDLPSAGGTPASHGHGHHQHHHHHSHQVQGGAGLLSSEMTGTPQGQYGRSPQIRAMNNEVGLSINPFSPRV